MSTASAQPGVTNSPVTFAIEDAVGIVTLDNPPANFFTFELMDELEAAAEAAADSNVRALLVRAAGPHFSAGADVRMFRDLSAASARQKFHRGVPMIQMLEDLPFPTLCATQGMCLAAGLELALACDLIWAGESSQFAQVEAKIGTSTLLGGAQRLAERAGAARAREICFTTDFYDAATFERWNIVNRIVPDEELAAASLAFAKSLATGPTRAHNVTKRLIRGSLDGGIVQADRLIYDIATPLFETEDMQHGVSTLLEHGVAGLLTKTTFHGR